MLFVEILYKDEVLNFPATVYLNKKDALGKHPKNGLAFRIKNVGWIKVDPRPVKLIDPDNAWEIKLRNFQIGSVINQYRKLLS